MEAGSGHSGCGEAVVVDSSLHGGEASALGSLGPEVVETPAAGAPVGLGFDVDEVMEARAAAARSAAVEDAAPETKAVAAGGSPAAGAPVGLGFDVDEVMEARAAAAQVERHRRPCYSTVWAAFKDEDSFALDRVCKPGIDMAAVSAAVSTCVIALCLAFDLAMDGSPPVLDMLPYQDAAADSGVDEFVGSAVNGATVVGFAAVLTYAIAGLYKWRCKAALDGLIAVAFFAAFALFALYCMVETFARLDVALDVVTTGVAVLNFATGATVAVLWTAPRGSMTGRGRVSGYAVVHRVHVVLLCVVLATPFLLLPEHSVFAAIVGLVFWDLFAVLAPCGPLRYLVRSEHGLIPGEPPPIDMPLGMTYEGRRFVLGTGDLLFFAVLVGRGSIAGFAEGVATFVGVHAGVIATCFAILYSRRLVLPALPLAAVLGVVSYFGARYSLGSYVHCVTTAGLYL